MDAEVTSTAVVAGKKRSADEVVVPAVNEAASSAIMLYSGKRVRLDVEVMDSSTEDAGTSC